MTICTERRLRSCLFRTCNKPKCGGSHIRFAYRQSQRRSCRHYAESCTGRSRTAIGQCSYAAGSDRCGSRGGAAARVAHIGLGLLALVLASVGIYGSRVLGRAAHQGDRDPDGARRDPAAILTHGAGRSSILVSCSHRARHERFIHGHAIREVDALRCRSIRSGHAVGRSRAVDDRRLGCKLDSGAACGERAADGSAPTGLTSVRAAPLRRARKSPPPCAANQRSAADAAVIVLRAEALEQRHRLRARQTRCTGPFAMSAVV